MKGLKAFKIKTLGAVVNKTDEWDRYAWKLLKEGMSNSFFKMIHSWLWMKSFEMVVTIQPFMFANYIFDFCTRDVWESILRLSLDAARKCSTFTFELIYYCIYLQKPIYSRSYILVVYSFIKNDLFRCFYTKKCILKVQRKNISDITLVCF